MNKTKDHLLSDKVKSLTASATLIMAQKGRELKAQGHDVISLSLGEPDFDTPDHIKEAAKKALDDGYTKYTPVGGLPEFKKAIIQKFKRDNNLEFEDNQIVVSNGAKQSIANIFEALLNKGDEVIIFTPYWVSYHDIVKIAGGTPVMLSAGIDQDFKSTADELAAVITDKTKAIIFSSPCNPTGSVYLKEELEAMATMLESHPDIVVISDEIYECINFTGKHFSIGSIPSMKDRTVTINGMSKGFAMTGWRLGYIGAPAWLASACVKLQGQVTSGATAFGQMAAAHALTSDMGPSEKMKDAFLKRRGMMIDWLSDIPGVEMNKPEGAFYAFPDVSAFFGKTDGTTTIKDSHDFAEYLLMNAHVATVAGAAFGANDCIRISYAASEAQLEEAMNRMKKALSGFNLS